MITDITPNESQPMKVVQHSPMGIDYTEPDLLLIEQAKKSAKAFMMRYTGEQHQQQEEAFNVEENERRKAELQKLYERRMRLYSEGMTAAEARETLGYSQKQFYRAVGAYRIHRERIPNTRGGKYCYNTDDVLRLFFFQQHKFIPKPIKQTTNNDTQ